MGRLAPTFEGRKIISRVPFVMEGRADAVSAQQGVEFPSSSFIHQDPMPFEIHRWIPRVYSLDENSAIHLDLGDAGLVLIYCTVHDFSQNQDLLKAPTTPLTLTRGSQDRVWEFAEPYTIEKSEGFSSRFDATPFDSDVNPSIRVMFTFEGFLLQLEGA